MLTGIEINPDAYYDLDALILNAGLRENAIVKARRSGELRSTKLGGDFLFRGQWIVDWLNSGAEASKRCSMPELNLSNLPELLTGGESRQLAGMRAWQWMEFLEQGKLPDPVKVDGRFKWRKSDILKWVAQLQSESVFAEDPTNG